jgi:RND family efflux transporter MFP subunit
MKKFFVGMIAVLSVAVLSFWAGGRYANEKAVGTIPQVEPVSAGAIRGQDNFAVPPSPGAVKINPDRQQLIGVRLAAVEKKPVTYTLRLYGRVVPDETTVYRVNASTDCWIRELSDVTTGRIVGKDRVLAEALAPAYYNAQLTYVLALDNVDRIRRQLGGEIRHQQTDLADNQIRMAVQSMQNLGITDAQIEELAKTRKARPYLQVRSPVKGVVLSRNITLNQWFKAGDEFYRIADIGKIWVYADVYEDEAVHMRPGMAVEVKHARMGKTFRAIVGEVLPLFDPAARTLKVRVDIDNPQYDLRPDMFVDVEIPITMPPSLNVPADALIDSGTRTIAYVDASNGMFEPRRVRTGWRLGRRIEITGGLTPGEKVVVSGNFLIDSESRMEIAAFGSSLKMSDDPVCGRFVDRDEAESFERTSAYANKKFYFCSDRCKKEFEKEPGKYVPIEEKDRKKSDRAVMTGGGGRTWADLLTPSKSSQAKKKEPEKAPEGPYPFPGARYLGTVPREPAPAEGEPPKDRLPPRQFEIPAAPPIGTRLK